MASGRPGRYAGTVPSFPVTRSVVISRDPEGAAARPQPGSSFKPFIYSAAFDRGFNAASIVNDAPLVFADPSQADG